MPLARSQGWESIWADLDALPDCWRTPEPSVLAWAESLRKAGGRKVLDLGGGIGRHTIPLARLGFAVTATDVSLSGVKTCAAWLAREGLSATMACHRMGTLPFPNCTFDGLIAYNVIYHATLAVVRGVLAEARRVLCLGGRFYTTFIAREDSKVAACQADVQAGRCQEIEPFTFVYPRSDDTSGDGYLPHHYCDEEELRTLLADFVVDDLYLDRRKYAGDDGSVRFSVHYRVRARLR